MKALTPTKPAVPRIPGVYVWEVPGKPISIRLSLDVVDRMQQEVMRGFGAVPKRGAEVGGILLGSAQTGDKAVVTVEDYALVPIEYKRGPSYLLSEQDARAFSNAFESARKEAKGALRPIGLFRSHTRDGVGLCPEDVALLDLHFPEPGAIALLIKPYTTKVSQAGFYFKDGGSFPVGAAPLLEFPYRRRELDPEGTPPSARSHGRIPLGAPIERRDKDALSPAPELLVRSGDARPHTLQLGYTPEAVPATPFAANAKAKGRSGWVWLPLSFIFLLLGLLLGFQAAISMRPQVPSGATNPFQLNIAVTKNGDNLQVRWDRQSLAIRTAQRGTMTIDDGTFNKTVDLDAGQLQNGSVVYRHYSKDVRFKLEVFPNERDSVSEIVEWKQ